MNKPVEVIAHFDTQGKLVPYRLKYEDAKQMVHIIRVDRVTKEKATRYNGNPMRIFTCRITDNNKTKIVTLFYEVDKCMWYMGMN